MSFFAQSLSKKNLFLLKNKDITLVQRQGPQKQGFQDLGCTVFAGLSYQPGPAHFGPKPRQPLCTFNRVKMKVIHGQCPSFYLLLSLLALDFPQNLSICTKTSFLSPSFELHILYEAARFPEKYTEGENYTKKHSTKRLTLFITSTSQMIIHLFMKK